MSVSEAFHVRPIRWKEKCYEDKFDLKFEELEKAWVRNRNDFTRLWI